MEQAASQTEQTKVELSLEQFETLKREIFNRASQHYTKFILDIQTLPCLEKIRLEAFRGFDNGFLWFKEGIMQLRPENLPPMQVVSAPQPEAASQSTAPQEATQTSEAKQAETQSEVA